MHLRFFCLIIHAVALLLIRKEIRFDVLIKLAGGDLKDLPAIVSNDVFRNLVMQFAFYNFIIVMLFILLGRIAAYVVKMLGLNNGQQEIFRLNNRWWYLFNSINSEISYFDIVLVDAMMDTKDGTMIFSGILMDFVCDGETLDRIYLRDAVRQSLKTITEGPESGDSELSLPITIPREIFIITYKNCTSLNLHFIILPDDIKVIEGMLDTSEPSEKPIE